VNGDGEIDFAEFELMLRYIEPLYFRIHKGYLEQVFAQYAQQSLDSQAAILTPASFEALAAEKQLFNQASFERFFESNSAKGFCNDYDDLIQNWEGIKTIIKHNIKFFEGETLPQMLSKVNALIYSTAEKDKNKIWLNYKLLEQELNRIHCETYISNLLSDELIELEHCLMKLHDHENN
jgi:hypothetical protein